jgi:hypothetical protein
MRTPAGDLNAARKDILEGNQSLEAITRMKIVNI